MQKIRFLLILMTLICLYGKSKAQDVALKTNGLYWLTTTTNLDVEVALSNKWTVELLGAYNPWTFSNDKKLRLWLVQPEAKYWLCEKFEGHFFGVHLHGGQFYSTLANKRRDGYLAGAGISYGYDWIITPHFNIEAEIGIGYAYLWYKESDCISCLRDVVNRSKNYFGPTKAAVSFVYLF